MKTHNYLFNCGFFLFDFLFLFFLFLFVLFISCFFCFFSKNRTYHAVFSFKISFLNYLGKQTVKSVRFVVLIVTWLIKLLMIDIFLIKKVFFLDICPFDL